MKLYSLLVRYEHGVCTISKLAEVPDWGPPTPSRIYRLIEADRDLYLKGRRCENQGLGIAAFAYYRRVVVNQKNTILDELIKACGKLGADRLLIVELEGAKDDGRFKESFAKVKHALPESLMINGHNPITLLHNALSEGIHENDDQECLERAEAIRVVLTEMAERIGNALKEQREVEAAVTKLMATQPARERP